MKIGVILSLLFSYSLGIYHKLLTMIIIVLLRFETFMDNLYVCNEKTALLKCYFDIKCDENYRPSVRHINMVLISCANRQIDTLICEKRFIKIDAACGFFG